MPETDPPPFNLDALLAEIAEDEKGEYGAKRILSQGDIGRLIEERARHLAAEPKTQPA
jgi:hypothetical protein